MNRSDIVLVRVPFVGSTGGKKRPALVIQTDGLNSVINETIIAEISSNLKHAAKPEQVLIDISTLEGAATGLLFNSVVRCNRLHTISQADIAQVIGQLAPSLMQQVEDALKSALGMP